MKRASRGFTLIELMITVAVVAILAAIAYPSYQEQVRKSRRAQAKADLIEYAQMAERHFSVNNSYAGFDLPATQSPRGGTAYYDLTPAETFTDATTFTITATAKDGQANDACGNLSINHVGQKTRTGSAAFSDCW